jgi:carbon monoxide dehydrogenase subunit G
MKIEGSFKLKANLQDAWDYFLSDETLGTCVPGAEQVKRVDEKTYDCVVKQKVGPISAKLKFKAVITEMDPPNHVKVHGAGEDIGKAGTFTMDLIVDMKDVGDGFIEIAYFANVTMVGRIATFGERIMRAKINSVLEEFIKNLENKFTEWSKK